MMVVYLCLYGMLACIVHNVCVDKEICLAVQ